MSRERAYGWFARLFSRGMSCFVIPVRYFSGNGEFRLEQPLPENRNSTGNALEYRMTQTSAEPQAPQHAQEHEPEAPHTIPRPHTDAAALRAIADAKADLHDRAEHIRAAPADHRPKLVLSDHVRGTSLLDKIADGVNKVCGSMWVFLGITIGIVVWLFLGNIVGFDKTPWPLLLVILNLPQLSIMISLQVSANRAQAASDRRAIADHETLIALHEMASQQMDILKNQDQVLDILHTFAAKDMPGRQRQIQDTANQILAVIAPEEG
jgi:uncharacterized membrane protein